MSQLINAVKHKNLHKITAHLDQMGQQDEQGLTALMHAAILNFTEAIEILISTPPKLSNFRSTFEAQPASETNKTDANGRTALMHAVLNNSVFAAEMLVIAESNQRDFSGLTALMHAAILNNSALCEVVICEKNHSIQGRTALMLAVEHGSADAVYELIPAEAGHFPLLSAVQFGAKSAILKIQENEFVDVVQKMNGSGVNWSAMMLAGVLGNVEFVQLLASREKGMICPVSGETALMRVVSSLAYTANLIKNSEIKLETHERKIENYVEIALYLADIDEEVGRQDKQGKTALMSAVMCWKFGEKIVRKLMEREVKLVDLQGLTCVAYCYDDEEMLELLDEYVSQPEFSESVTGDRSVVRE